MKINLSELLCSGGQNALFKHSTLVFAMRVSFVYIMLGLCTMSVLLAAESNAQRLEEIRVTVELNNEGLSSLFNQIQDQTGLHFAFLQPEIGKIAPLTISRQTTDVKAILDLVFTNTKLEYKQINYSVIVFEKVPDIVNGELTRIVISGTVKDKAGIPLPGVSILLKGTNTGTSTDGNGQYSIIADPDVFLVFSFIGYKTFETVPGDRSVVDVVLEEDTKVLQEVTINGGYYETSDRLKTGSIVKITSKEVENQPVTSPLMALQGRVAGLEITPTTGAPGTAPTIRVRGNNSLRILGKGANQDGNYPLYVIDGVPISSAPIQTFGYGMTSGGYDPLSTINVSNIASIEVLKDGDATAIYGSRGANGVILITTKRSSAKGKTNLDVNVYRGWGWIPQRLNLLNTQQYLAMRREALKNDGLPEDGIYQYDLNLWDSTRYTDWQDVLMGGTSKITDVQTTLSSGNQNTTFNITLGYHRETLLFSDDFGYNKGTGGISLTHLSTDQKFTASLSANYGIDKNQLFNNDFIRAALELPPNAPALYKENGDLNWEIANVNGSDVATWVNPMSFTKQTQTAVIRNFLANGNFSYEVLPGLKLSTSLGLTDLVNRERSQIPKSSLNPTTTGSGSGTFVDGTRGSWIIEPKASYSKNWQAHELNLVGGGTWQQSTNQNNVYIASRYSSDALLGTLKGAQVIDFSERYSEYKYVSAYARAGYNFDKKYLFNLSVRRDGSSRFGPDSRFGNFWSAGAAWIFTEENFLKPAFSVLNFGKLRASYGVTGSDAVSDYQYYSLYEVSGIKYQDMAGLNPAYLFNPLFAWETTRKLEGALELGFFQSRITAEVNWYRNRSSNQLVQYTLPATTGFNSVLQNFDAVVQNSGLEILVRGEVLSQSDWRWVVSVNVSMPKNKLVQFDGLEDSPYKTYYKVGEPTSILYLYQYKGVNTQTGLYEVVDRNKDGVLNNSDKVLKDALGNKLYGGLTNSIQYKGFELSFLFQFANTKTRFSGSSTMPGFRVNQPDEVLARWQNTGDQTNIQRFATTGGAQSPLTAFINAKIESDASIIDGSFIRLKTFSLNYSLPGKWANAIRFQQARIFVQGQNLLTIAKYPGLDPETGNNFPPLRMITMGIQLKL